MFLAGIPNRAFDWNEIGNPTLSTRLKAESSASLIGSSPANWAIEPSTMTLLSGADGSMALGVRVGLAACSLISDWTTSVKSSSSCSIICFDLPKSRALNGTIRGSLAASLLLMYIPKSIWPVSSTSSGRMTEINSSTASGVTPERPSTIDSGVGSFGLIAYVTGAPVNGSSSCPVGAPSAGAPSVKGNSSCSAVGAPSAGASPVNGSSSC